MFNQIRTRGGVNLKFISTILFTATFLVGGFFVTNTAQAYIQTDFAAFDGVNITPVGTNSYTVSSGITATYDNGTGTESSPVLLKLKGYAPIVIPWFHTEWTTYNYVTIGIKLPSGFVGIPITGGTAVSSTGVKQYDVNPSGIYMMGDGSTALATTGDAFHYLDFSFGANKSYVKNGLVFLKVIWNTGSTPEYFTIDINGLQTGPVFIDKNTNGTFDSGELSFNTIQAAIDANTTVDGDTIIVGAGTYHEQVIIDKALSVLGAGAATTFIDGTGVTPVQPGLVNITNETGAVTLDGFTIRNAPAKDEMRITIWAKQAEEGPVYNSSMTITHNILVGSGLVFTDDYGLYSNHNKSNLVFSYNDVSNFGGNALLFELHTGPAEISHNTITVYPSGPTAIFSMSYKDGYNNNNDVTEKQWLHDNTINANGGSAIVMASAYGYAGYNELTNGKYTNVEITDNVITNVGNASKGIQLEVDGDNGGFVNPLITGNTISAQNPGSGTSRGIRIMGVVTGAQITDNEITGFYRGIYQSDSFSHLVYPTNTQISTNVITGGTYGIDIAGGTATIHLNSIVGNTLFGVNNQTVATIDATNNWWGDASGPYDNKEIPGGTPNYSNPLGTGSPVSSYVDYNPWCTNSTCITPDTTPDAFSFTDQTDVALSTVIESNTITVAGINVSADVSVVGGEYSVNGGAYTSTSGAVVVGATVRVHHTSSASNSTAVDTTLTIGDVSDTFTSTTLAASPSHSGGRNPNAATPAVPAKIEIPDGCAAGNKFSTTTGRNCNAATPAVPAGQVLGAEKFNFSLFLKWGPPFNVKVKGPEVMELQTFLNTAGYGPLVVDGRFGGRTKSALVKFQIANGLKGDGIVGALTRAFLNK